MSLEVTVNEKKTGFFVFHLNGSLDTDTYTTLETEVGKLLNEKNASPSVIVFDMKGLTYVSSMGISVIVKTKQGMKEAGGMFDMINIQPKVREIFDIVNAFPFKEIYVTPEELDSYIEMKLKEHQEQQPSS